MAPPSQPFGELLRRHRAAAGLTQEELAAHAGLTPHGISLLERGERRRPQAYTVHALADALELVDADRVHFAAAAKGRAAINGSRPTMHTTEEDEVLDALDAAYAARLLDEDSYGYRFAHDLVREVVEADVRQSRRAVWHRRIAESLKQTEETVQPDLIAYHYGRSDDRAKAALYLERAGDSAQAEYANAAAEGYYRELVQCLKSLGRVPDAARAREKLAAVLTTTARYDAALVVLEQAAEAYRMSEDLESLGRVTAEIGRAHASKGTPGEGVNRLQPLLVRLEQASLVGEELALPVVIGPGIVITPGVADDFEDKRPGHGADLVMRVSCDTRRR